MAAAIKQLRKAICALIEYSAHFHVQVEEWKDRDKSNLALFAKEKLRQDTWAENTSGDVEREQRRQDFVELVMVSSGWAKNSTTLSKLGAAGKNEGHAFAASCGYEWKHACVVSKMLGLHLSTEGKEESCGEVARPLWRKTKMFKLEGGQDPGGKAWRIEGKKMLVTRNEFVNLKKECHKSFMPQRGMWHLRTRDAGEGATKNGENVVRIFKAMAEEELRSGSGREAGPNNQPRRLEEAKRGIQREEWEVRPKPFWEDALVFLFLKMKKAIEWNFLYFEAIGRTPFVGLFVNVTNTTRACCDLQGRKINFTNSKTLVGRCRDRPPSSA